MASDTRGTRKRNISRLPCTHLVQRSQSTRVFVSAGGTAFAMGAARTRRAQKEGLIYVANSQGHLYDVWWKNKRQAQVTFHEGKEHTHAIAEEMFRALAAGQTRDNILRIRDTRYKQAQREPMRHNWDPRILKACDSAMRGKLWKGEVSPRHSRLCSFA